MNNNEDIWSGGSIRKTTDGKKYDERHVHRMTNNDNQTTSEEEKETNHV